MQTERGFYICPTCFRAAEVRLECHGHNMIHYRGYPADHQQLKPLEDGEGDDGEGEQGGDGGAVAPIAVFVELGVDVQDEILGRAKGPAPAVGEGVEAVEGLKRPDGADDGEEEQGGREEGQDDVADGLPRVGAVDPGGLFEIARDGT